MTRWTRTKPNVPRKRLKHTPLLLGLGYLVVLCSIAIFIQSHVLLTQDLVPNNGRFPVQPPRTITTTQTAKPQTMRTPTNLHRHHTIANNSTVALVTPDQPLAAATSNNRKQPPKAVIGYAVTITGCGDQILIDGAAILSHSIRVHSYPRNPTSHYASKLYAFVHPDALPCAVGLTELGYEVQERETPVNATDIRGEFLRENIHKVGCCGAAELIKLYAYTLVEHPVVVHVDCDVLILRPLDELFDAMLGDGDGSADADDGSGSKSGTGSKSAHPSSTIPYMFPAKVDPQTPIPAFFTRDYNLAYYGKKYPGIQGGFLVVRPNISVYNDYIQIITEGNFVKGQGWAGLGIGNFWGGRTIQGVVSYYYDHFHPQTAVELNRCLYNSMSDRAKPECGTNDDKHTPKTTEDCEDCTATNIDDIRTIHFTLCQKPWVCSNWKTNNLCQRMKERWFRMRRDWETENIPDWKPPTGKFLPEIFHGYCRHENKKGYLPIDMTQLKQ